MAVSAAGSQCPITFGHCKTALTAWALILGFFLVYDVYVAVGNAMATATQTASNSATSFALQTITNKVVGRSLDFAFEKYLGVATPLYVHSRVPQASSCGTFQSLAGRCPEVPSTLVAYSPEAGLWEAAGGTVAFCTTLAINLLASKATRVIWP